MLDVFQSLGTTQISIMLRKCQNESGVCDGLQPVAWTVLMLRGTPEYVQFISKEVLARLNWILFPQCLHSHNIFGEHLRKVVLTPRRADVDSSKRKHHRPRGVKKCLPPEKKNKTLVGSKEHSAFERANTPYCRPVHLDAEVQTGLTASGIEVSLMASSPAFIDKSKSSSRLLFAILIVHTFSTKELSFWRN